MRETLSVLVLQTKLLGLGAEVGLLRQVLEEILSGKPERHIKREGTSVSVNRKCFSDGRSKVTPRKQTAEVDRTSTSSRTRDWRV